ncbi:MAG: hypothetical protein HY608_03635, partial [Planctomycetes bacterium]|nr:hypothetical protein [Planctomycetota bacterium]
PRGTARLVELIRTRTGYPPEWLEWLGANDLGMACANGLAAWLAGCSSCAGTVAGVGERAGWAPTELLLAHYVGLRGEANGVGFKALPGVVKPLREAGREVPPRAPLCGDAVLQTSHPESALRPETAFAFDPERVLGRPVQEGFRPGCGLDELARCVARLRGWSVADPSNPEVVRLKEWLDASFAGGRSSAVGFDEIRARLQTFARDVPGGGEAPPPI